MCIELQSSVKSLSKGNCTPHTLRKLIFQARLAVIYRLKVKENCIQVRRTYMKETITSASRRDAYVVSVVSLLV